MAKNKTKKAMSPRRRVLLVLIITTWLFMPPGVGCAFVLTVLGLLFMASPIRAAFTRHHHTLTPQTQEAPADASKVPTGTETGDYIDTYQGTDGVFYTVDH
jgi:UPF0716 family protein affecting phage T7 exclusion